MSRLTYDKLELRKVSTDLVAVIQSVVEGVTMEIRERKQTLVLRLAEHLYVEGDPARLAEVVSNLLSNASRYTPERGRIEVSGRRDRDEVVIGVRDTGIGLRQEDIERMFEPFVQIDATKGGLGIGLALVKGLVELHGGTISGQSEGPGQGCLFTVRLPVAERRRAAPEALRGPIPRLSRRVRVLIVDDYEGFADSLALYLGRMGAETLCAYSGTDGIDKARMWHPDAMLVDLGLPDMTGFEVAQRVRSRAGAEGVLLIAVTGSAEEGSGRIARCGFDGSLAKPIDTDRMHALLEQKGAPAKATSISRSS
jgi:CheY-like chemotaxis protein